MTFKMTNQFTGFNLVKADESDFRIDLAGFLNRMIGKYADSAGVETGEKGEDYDGNNY